MILSTLQSIIIIIIRPFPTVVRIRTRGAFVVLSGIVGCPRRGRAAGSLGGGRRRRRSAATYVDVGYEQPQGVGPGRELGFGQRVVVNCGRGDDGPVFGHRIHGHLQRPFSNHFLVRVKRLDQLGDSKSIRKTR